MKRISVAVANKRIEVQLYEPPLQRKNTAILYLHGWNSRPNQFVLDMLSERDYLCVAPVFWGHEGSDGAIQSVTAADALADAVAAYDFLREQVGNEDNISVIGSSYGAYIGALLTEERPVSALALRVPANYPDERFDQPKWGDGAENEQINQWRQQALSWQSNRALAAVHAFRGHIQIIESGADEQVPHQTVKNYVDAVYDPAKLEYKIMPNWPHSFSYHSARAGQYVDTVFAWLDNLP